MCEPQSLTPSVQAKLWKYLEAGSFFFLLFWYLSFNPGGPNAGQVDGLVLPRVELDYHGIGVDHLHHLQRNTREGRVKIK